MKNNRFWGSLSHPKKSLDAINDEHALVVPLQRHRGIVGNGTPRSSITSIECLGLFSTRTVVLTAIIQHIEERRQVVPVVFRDMHSLATSGQSEVGFYRNTEG